MQIVDNLFHRHDRALGRHHGFLLHADHAPHQHVAFAVGLLRVNHGHVRPMRGNRRQLFSGKRALDKFDARVVLDQVGSDVAAQHAEGQVRGAGAIGRRHAGMRVFFDLDGLGPVVFDRVAQAVQRPDARISAPGEDDLLDAPGADELIVDQVRGHADHGEIALGLPDDLVSGGERDQVREPFQGDRVAVANRFADRF